MNILLKLRSWILLAICIALFFIDKTAGCLIAFVSILILLAFEKRLLKMLTSWGFLIFAVLVLTVPLLGNFTLGAFITNLLIVLRGILIIFLIYMGVKDISSSRFYSKIEHHLPDEITNIIKISLNLLPTMKDNLISQFNEARKSNKSRQNQVIDFFKFFVNVAEELSISLEKTHKPNVYIVTGKKHEGKSTLALKLAEMAKEKGLKTGGIISISQNNNGKRSGYEIMDLKTGLKKPLATTKDIENYAENIGPFYFYKDGIEFAHSALDINHLNECDIVFIDEVGMLEASEKGFYKDLKQLLNSDIKLLMFVTRDEFIKTIENKFNFKAKEIFSVSSQGTQDLSSLKERFISATRF